MYKICKTCKKEFLKPYARSKREWSKTRFCSKKCYGKETAERMTGNKLCVGRPAWNKGLKGIRLNPTTEFKKGNVAPNKGKELFTIRGTKHWNWKGGITPKNVGLRNSIQYKEWRTAVFVRDKYQCVFGGKEHGNNLQAHHVKRFSEYPKLRFVVSNGITVCEDCHKQFGTFREKQLTVALCYEPTD